MEGQRLAQRGRDARSRSRRAPREGITRSGIHPVVPVGVLVDAVCTEPIKTIYQSDDSGDEELGGDEVLGDIFEAVRQ